MRLANSIKINVIASVIGGLALSGILWSIGHFEELRSRLSRFIDYFYSADFIEIAIMVFGLLIIRWLWLYLKRMNGRRMRRNWYRKSGLRKVKRIFFN